MEVVVVDVECKDAGSIGNDVTRLAGTVSAKNFRVLDFRRLDRKYIDGNSSSLRPANFLFTFLLLHVNP